MSDVDLAVDVLVVGSGAGGLTAGLQAHDLGAETLVIEKSALYGGSSAMSGGCVWIPHNPLMAEAGLEDSADDALRYLSALVGDRVSQARLAACVAEGPRMVRYLQDRTDVVFRVLTYPDYYPRVEGARENGRTLDVAPLHGSRLGASFAEMRPLHPQMVFGRNFALTFAEAKRVMHQEKGWQAMMLRRAAAYFLDLPARLAGPRDRRACLGGALVARLRASLARRKVPLWLETAFTDLLLEGGRATGVIARRAGGEVRIRARQGVILAAGGFEKNQRMRQRFLPAPTDAAWSTASPDNTGDAIEAGLRHGLATDFLDEAWWGPTNPIPGRDHGVAYMFVTERCAPGSLIVNRDGVRVVNEAAPYPDVVRAMYGTPTAAGAPSVPLYLIVDAGFRERSALGPLLPGQADEKVPRRLLDAHYFTKAGTLPELARRVGIEERALLATVERFNGFAAAGRDLDFGRGDSAYDRYWANPRNGANPCLGPLVRPPFYSLELYPGDIGTRGGLQVDEHARVLDGGGEVVPGLYAIGNCSAPVYGASYPGAGSTIGPAMTFGYVAARHAVARGAGAGAGAAA